MGPYHRKPVDIPFQLASFRAVGSKDFRPFRGRLQIGVATAVVPYAVDVYAPVKVEVPGQRPVGNNIDGGIGFIQTGPHGISGPKPHIRVGMAHRAVVSGLHRADTCDEGPGAGSEVTPARLHEIPQSLPSGRLQAAPVPHGLSAVQVHHPETGLPVRIQQDTVLIHGRTGHQFPLPQGIRTSELVLCGGTVRSGHECLHGEPEHLCHRKVGPGVEHDAAVHEDIFVIAFCIVLPTGNARSGKNQKKDRYFFSHNPRARIRAAGSGSAPRNCLYNTMGSSEPPFSRKVARKEAAVSLLKTPSALNFSQASTASTSLQR